MALKMILDLGATNGESKLSGFEDKIDIDQYSIDYHQSGTFHRGGGGGGGAPTVGDLMMSKKLDKASYDLCRKVCLGNHYPEATLRVFKSTGGGVEEYFKIKLTNVIVSSYSMGGDGNGLDYISESFSLNFEQIETQYQLQNQDGILSDGGSMMFNVATNESA